MNHHINVYGRIVYSPIGIPLTDESPTTSLSLLLLILANTTPIGESCVTLVNIDNRGVTNR